MTLTLVCFAAVYTDLERTASCIASAGHAWAVPVSDIRGALRVRALFEVTIMPVFIAVYT